MTAIPLWSALYGTTNPGDIQFSPDRLTAYVAGGGQDGIFVAVNLTALGGGPRTWGVTSAAAGVDIGIINGAELPTASGDPTNGVMVRANGSIEFFSTATGYQGWGLITGWTAGAKTWPVVNTAANMIWFTQDNVSFWGYAGTYPTGTITAYALSDVVAGNPGGIPTSHIAAIYPYVYIYSASGQPATLDGTSTPPTGLFNIPGTLAISAPPTSTQGSATQIPWVSGRTEASAITESPDGGAFVTAGGTNTGTSGTATGSTYGATSEHTVALKSVTEPLDQTTPISFVAFPVVAGAGALLANIFIQYKNIGGTETLVQGPTSGTFPAASSSLLYNVFAYTTGGSAIFGVHIYADGAQTVQAFGWSVNVGDNLQLSAGGASSPTSGSETGTATYPRISGSGSIVIDSVSGTNSIGHGSVLNAGTAGAWSPGSIMVEGAPSPATPYVNWKFLNGTVNDNIFAAQIYAAPAPETLTITTSGYVNSGAGTLYALGADVNETLGTLGLSIDGGTYSVATGLSVTGTAYIGYLVGSLSAGSHTVTAQNLATGTTSSPSTFTVSGAPTLTISASYATGTTTITGTDLNEPLVSMNLSVDGAPFDPASSLSITGTAFTATILGTLANGPHYAEAQNGLTGTTSNVAPFTVSGPAETILLNYGSCVAGGTLSIGGTVTNGPAPALNISTTAGVTYAPAATYISGSGTSAVFSATNGTLAPGNYTLYAQDAVSGVISNPLPLTVPQAGTVTGISPYNLATPAFTTIYNTSQIIPLQAVPSQQVSATLNGQAITLTVYQRGGAVYMDIYVNGTAVLVGQLCLNQVFIIRSAYLGVVGDFAFWDSQATASGVALDPTYTGIGSRFLLVYYS